MKTTLVSLLVLFLTSSNLISQNIETMDELKGVEFLGPIFYTIENDDGIDFIDTNVEKCAYRFFKGPVDQSLFSEDDLSDYYKGFIKAVENANPESIVVDQTLITIGKFLAMQTELLFLDQEGNTELKHLILVVDEVYYSFQESKVEGESCSDNYNFDIMKESIIVKNPKFKTQYTERSDFFVYMATAIALGAGTVIGIVIGIVALIRWII